MTDKLLWSSTFTNTLIEKFINNVSTYTKSKDYLNIHKWSIKNKDKFWNEIWNFTNIIGNKKGAILKNSNDFINSVFFENSELNFTENCLTKNDNSDAIIFFSENNKNRKYSWKEVNELTFKLSYYLSLFSIRN